MTALERERSKDHSLKVLSSCTSEDVLVLRVAGEIDLVTVQRLGEHLDVHIPGPQQGVVLDLSRVSFLAASGIGLLVRFAERASAEGVLLRLVARHRSVLRALEATGTDGLLPRCYSVREAVMQCSACHPPG